MGAYLPCRRFGTTKTKFPLYHVKLGVKSAKEHYLGFIVNRPILLQGFGIYGTKTSFDDIDVDYGVYVEHFCNPINQKTALIRKRITMKMNGHRDIIPIIFPQAVPLQCCQQYILYLNINSYQTYMGMEGIKCVRLDQVQFTFSDYYNSISLSSIATGNFPELYYDIPKQDKLYCPTRK